MLVSLLDTTLKGMEVSILPIFSVTTLFNYITLIAENKSEEWPYIWRGWKSVSCGCSISIVDSLR